MARRDLSAFRNREPWHNPREKPFILIDQISKSFAHGPALSNVYLEIYRGEFFSLLGASGCGKSTLLRILAGLEKPDQGRIIIDGTEMTDYPPHKRPVNMMFQNYALFPHMTVEENVRFGLLQEGLSKGTIQRRSDEILHLVQLEKYRDRKPHQLSGGQKQRTALARALVKRPKLLLLDEPLAALDQKLREQTQFELVNIQRKVGITFIVVTHDQQEAMTVSSRIGVMDEGKICQVGTPQEVYEFPSSEYVADFIGRTNLFYGVVVGETPEFTTVKTRALRADIQARYRGATALGAQVTLAIRPEKIQIHRQKPNTKYNYAHGVVQRIAYFGSCSLIHLRIGGEPSSLVKVMMTNLSREEMGPFSNGDDLYLSWESENVVVLVT